MGRTATKKTASTASPRPRRGFIDFDEELEALRRFSKKVCATRETAFAYLVKHGYVTPKGKITKRYK